MNVWVVVAGTLITALAVWYVVTPLLESRDGEPSSGRAPAPEERYWETLRAILDLEADYETGKLERSDYEAAVRELKLEAAKILRSAQR